MKPTIDYTVYVVTPTFKPEQMDEWLTKIEEVCRSNAAIIQLRLKDTVVDPYPIAMRIRELTNFYNKTLIINDDVELALKIGADGVHVGQEDSPAKTVRQSIGQDKILGVSAASLSEAKKAEEEGADYIGAGSMFPTKSKGDAKPLSFASLKVMTQKVQIPIVAIGGISHSNLHHFNGVNIAGVAVISAIFGCEDPKVSANRLMKKLQGMLQKSGLV